MKLVTINPKRPERGIIQKAAALIRAGGLVAFPTETVYGLGADALNPRAIRKLFKAKGRPAGKPLIVGIAHRRDIARVAKRIPPRARLLIKKFWPGPLTLVLKKRAAVPAAVTAGGTTVALRMPAHPVALALIRASRTPIVVPSANRSGKPPPREAKRVARAFTNVPGLILDGGVTPLGIPSTVLDLTAPRPAILRKGSVSQKALRRFIG